MSKIRTLIGLAVAIGVFTSLAATAMAQLESTTTTGKATGTAGVLSLSPGVEVKCNRASGTWTIQKVEESQSPVTLGGHLKLELNFEGKPKSGTTTGKCETLVGTTLLQAQVETRPVKLQIQQPTKGVSTNLKGKLENDVKVVIDGASCEIFIPSKSNQQLGKTNLETSGANVLVKPEVESVTTEVKGAGCGLAGVKGGKEGKLALEVGGKLLLEGIKLV